MSRPVTVEWEQTTEELRERFVAECDVARRTRLQALWLVRCGVGVAASAQQVGVGTRTLERWLGWYRADGLDAVLSRVPGHGAVGAPSKLTPEQRDGLVERCDQGAVHTYGEAADWVRSAYGISYAYNGMWSLLTRVGVRPKVPRPAAEKADRVAQEAFKKGGLLMH